MDQLKALLVLEKAHIPDVLYVLLKIENFGAKIQIPDIYVDFSNTVKYNSDYVAKLSLYLTHLTTFY